MKIVEVISQMNRRGGAEVFFESLVFSLAKSNDVYCIVLHDGLDPSFESLKILLKDKFFFCHKKKGFDISSNLRFRSLIKHIKPDVVHSHCQVAMSYFFSFGFKRQSFKYFHTLHSIASKESPFYDRAIKKKMIRNNLLKPIAISRFVEKTVEDVYGVTCPVVENGINATRFKHVPKKERFEGNFICIAGFRPVKNHKLLLKAFARLKELGLSFHLTCCGTGETLDESIELSKELGIRDLVDFVGQVSDVTPFLKVNDCMVLSSFYEGSPISIIEGISSGLPCIAPDVGGISELLSFEKELLFEKNSLDGLVEALTRFYRHPDEYSKCSTEAREFSSSFSIESCASSYLKVFEEKK